MTNYADKEASNTAISGFFCHACLADKLAAEASPDPRYCQGCYDFLLKEAEILIERGMTRRPDWMPQIEGEKERQVEKDMSGIKSTVGGGKSEVDIIHPLVAARTAMRRGPKHKALPHELIKQWAGESMGSKAIASRLKNELGITVSYKTVQRALAGE